MNCLLIAATTSEIAPFTEHIRKSAGNNIIPDVLITGIGLTATAYHLTRQLHMKKYNLVVQAGIAGCFDKKFALGTVLAIQKDAIADQGVAELGQLKTLFDLKLVPADQPPYTNAWLLNPSDKWLNKTNLQQVTSISVNEITTNQQQIGLYQEKFAPVTESMEGAALHYTCLMEKTAFVQLRSLSNYIGERNKANWKMKESIENLNTALIQFLQHL